MSLLSHSLRGKALLSRRGPTVDASTGRRVRWYGKALTVKRDAIGRRYCVDEVNGVMRRVPCGREGMEELNARRVARDKEAVDKAREAIDAYRRGDTLASEMLASLQGLTRDQLRGLRSSMGLDKRGDSLKKDLAEKIRKAALATLEVRHLEPYGDKDKVGIDEPSVGNSEKPVEAPKPFPTSWSKTSSSRSVDAYRVGNVLKINGQWGVVTGYKRTMDDHGGFRHTLSLRPASEEEAKQGRIGELKGELRAMSPGPDDDRDRAKHAARQKELDNEIRRLEGRPSVEEERAAIVAERRADFENAWTNGDVYDRLQHIQAVANRPGAPLHNRTSWSNLAEKTGIPAEKLMSVFDKEQKFTDDELNKIATAAGITLDQLKYGTGHVPHDDPKFTGIAANGIYYKDGVPQKKVEKPTPNAPAARVDTGPAHSVPGLVSRPITPQSGEATKPRDVEPDPRVTMRIKRVQELIARADAKARDGGLSKATRERNAGDAAKRGEKNSDKEVDKTKAGTTIGGVKETKPAEETPKVELPKLTGSEKQVAWANEIRNSLASSVGHSPRIKHIADAMIPVVGGELAKLPADAKWWIDNKRNLGFPSLFASRFGLDGKSSDATEAAGRAYRVIEDHLNYNAQVAAQGGLGETTIGEDDTNDLVHSAGSREKANEIAAAFGFALHGS